MRAELIKMNCASETVWESEPCLEYALHRSADISSDISRTNRADYLAANSPEVDFALVLTRTIDSIKSDPSQLRNTVYELARTKLLMLVWEQEPRISVLQLRRMMLSFETAIQHVETHASRQDELQLITKGINAAQIGDGPERNQRDPVLIVDQTALANEPRIIPDFSHPTEGLSRDARRKRNQSWAAMMLRVGFVAIVLGVAGVIISKYLPPAMSHVPSVLHAGAGAIQKSDSLVARAQLPAVQLPSLPLPSVYGIYAVNNSGLHELEALPGRVPDQRVFMSTPVKTKSRTMLPDGRIAFIVFRRDMTISAPDHVAVSVIAKVVRDMTFNSTGKASTTSVDDQWAIRSTSYDLRVAPLNDNAEMLLLRPENPDFVFPAGRYGLVLKGQAFDFSVAGPITESEQCLERVIAANGSFYSECRSL